MPDLSKSILIDGTCYSLDAETGELYLVTTTLVPAGVSPASKKAIISLIKEKAAKPEGAL